jgi:hypothetical protein
VLPVNVPFTAPLLFIVVPLMVPLWTVPVAAFPSQLVMLMAFPVSWPVIWLSPEANAATPETGPAVDVWRFNTPGPSGEVTVPQYTVTTLVVELRLEKPPLMPEPVYVPDSTPRVMMPVNANVPPERATELVAESYVPVSVVVFPPVRWTLPDTCDTASGRIVRLVTVVWIVRLSVPLWPPLPAIVPWKVVVVAVDGVVGVGVVGAGDDWLPPQAPSAANNGTIATIRTILDTRTESKSAFTEKPLTSDGRR